MQLSNLLCSCLFTVRSHTIMLNYSTYIIRKVERNLLLLYICESFIKKLNLDKSFISYFISTYILILFNKINYFMIIQFSIISSN